MRRRTIPKDALLGVSQRVRKRRQQRRRRSGYYLSIRSCTAHFLDSFGSFFLTAKRVAGRKINERNQSNQKSFWIWQRKETRAKENNWTPRSAWFARNEVVKFRKSTRFENSAMNFRQGNGGFARIWMAPLVSVNVRRLKTYPTQLPFYRLFKIIEMPCEEKRNPSTCESLS